MKPSKHVLATERGSGLVIAIMILVVMAALAAGLISAMSTDRRSSSYDFARGTALDYAEAGVAEALDRIRAGDVPDNRNPRMVAQIFRVSAGSVPAVGADTVGMPTAQPTGQFLPYSSDSKGPDVLTVQYMTNAARTGIYFYDATKDLPIQGKSGTPIYSIRSIGRAGIARREVDVVVTPATITPNLKGGLVSDSKVKLHGAVSAIGFDYQAETPAGTGVGGVRNGAFETGIGNVPGVWSTGSIDIKAPSKAVGTPNTSPSQSGFYSGPWDVLNMSQSQFYNWIGPAQGGAKGKAPLPSGVVYLSSPGDKPGNGKTKFSFDGGSGDGFLYVNGDLEIKGDFTFRGLIYVEGDVKIKGTGWILGGLVIGDKSKLNASHHEGLTVLKSSEAVSTFLNAHKTPFITLNWREG
jgi:Tfp pilus assembly protein PilX